MMRTVGKCEMFWKKWKVTKCCELSGCVMNCVMLWNVRKCCELFWNVANCQELWNVAKCHELSQNDVILKLGLDIKVIPWTARASSRSKTSYFATSKSFGNFSPCSTLLIKFWSSLAGHPQLRVFRRVYRFRAVAIRGGGDYAHHFTTCPPDFQTLDLPTTLQLLKVS